MISTDYDCHVTDYELAAPGLELIISPLNICTNRNNDVISYVIKQLPVKVKVGFQHESFDFIMRA
jgi:hypothetical protein